MYIDIPSRSDIERLISVRAPACVSIYVRTTPLTQEAQKDRTELKNFGRSAVDQLRAQDADKRTVAAIDEAIGDLVDDDEFWRFQANSLAVLVTPDTTTTFRLPNRLEPLVEVSDRFHVKPLLRSITVPQTAFVLALAQGSVRVVEVFADMPAVAVKVDGLPRDAASAVGKSSILDRAPVGRIQGSEGQKVRLRQYARQVDHALRDLLGAREIPLILAATAPLDSIFRSVNTYPHLVDEGIAGIQRPSARRSLLRHRAECWMACSRPRWRSSTACSKLEPPRGAPRRTSPTPRVPRPGGGGGAAA